MSSVFTAWLFWVYTKVSSSRDANMAQLAVVYNFVVLYITILTQVQMYMIEFLSVCKGIYYIPQLAGCRLDKP